MRATGPVAMGIDFLGQMGRALRGKPTLQRAWRGAPLRPTAIADALEGAGVDVSFKRYGHRHTWVILHKGTI